MDHTLDKPPQVAAEATATERAYAALLGWIERREIGSGSVLDERRLAEAINVSRTPLRTALSRLQGEGFIVRLSNGAMVVRDIGSGEVLELLFVRRLLEPEAASLAAGRIPADALDSLRTRLTGVNDGDSPASVWLAGDEVHDLVANHCGNRSLGRLIQDARRRIRMSSIERVPGRDNHAVGEHLAIVDALKAGDEEAARQAMTRHLDNIRDGFLSAFGVGAAHVGG
ncbi:GntR family transcriptional regulator [Geminicoccaceae bacterium 1502E]|nr:GntR family transcriptional regulator [Geminicoccaceae bacterium 1502E]